MPAAPDPALDYEHLRHPHLREVRPVCRTQATEGLRATLLSIEYYDRGTNIVMLLEQDPTATVTIVNGIPALSAIDDAGTRHPAMLRAASGSGGPGGASMHLVATFAPGLDFAAQSLTIEMLLARSVSWAVDANDCFADGILGGPWRFTFPLDQGATAMGDPDSSVVRVIPVGQHRQFHDIGVTVYSIELYRDRFQAVARLDWEGRGGFPRLTWRAVDDRGGVYDAWPAAGSGGGKPPELFSWRLICPFTPQLDPEARHLTLEIETLQWGSGAVLQVPDSALRFTVGLS